jgi:hypothetical protein
MDFKIVFEGAAKDEANQLAADLRSALREADPDINAEVGRDSATSMDIGMSVWVALASTPAALVLARAVLAWAKRNNKASMNLYSKNGTLELTNLESKDVAEIVRAFDGKKK